MTDEQVEKIVRAITGLALTLAISNYGLIMAVISVWSWAMASHK